MANEKRLIDANAFLEHWNKEYRHQYANDMFKIAIANFPTVDAVEVVRCKDCKHCRLASWGERYCIRDKFVEWGELKEDDFCSFGERRTE